MRLSQKLATLQKVMRIHCVKQWEKKIERTLDKMKPSSLIIEKPIIMILKLPKKFGKIGKHLRVTLSINRTQLVMLM
jgi:hypothetical protein